MSKNKAGKEGEGQDRKGRIPLVAISKKLESLQY